MGKTPIQGIEGDKKSPVDLSISLCQETQNKQLKKNYYKSDQNTFRITIYVPLNQVLITRIYSFLYVPSC